MDVFLKYFLYSIQVERKYILHVRYAKKDVIHLVFLLLYFQQLQEFYKDLYFYQQLYFFYVVVYEILYNNHIQFYYLVMFVKYHIHYHQIFPMNELHCMIIFLDKITKNIRVKSSHLNVFHYNSLYQLNHQSYLQTPQLFYYYTHWI